MEMGLFEVVVRTVNRGDALPIETSTTKVTTKGQMYFVNKFLGRKQD
jgi:anti-repressor protein